MASILGAPSPRRGRSQHAGTAMATIMSAPSPRRELPVAEVEQRRLSWAARNPRCGSSSRIEAALTDGTSSGQQHKLRLSRSPAAPSPAASPHSPAAGQRKPPTFNEAGGAAATFAVPSYPAPPAVQSPYDGAREHAARAARNADEARAVRERELQVARAQLEAAETRAAEAAAAAAAQRQRLAHAAQAEQAAHDFGGTGGGVRGFGGGGGGSGGGGGGVSRACAAALGGEFGGGAARAVPCRRPATARRRRRARRVRRRRPPRRRTRRSATRGRCRCRRRGRRAAAGDKPARRHGDGAAVRRAVARGGEGGLDGVSDRRQASGGGARAQWRRRHRSRLRCQRRKGGARLPRRAGGAAAVEPRDCGLELCSRRSEETARECSGGVDAAGGGGGRREPPHSVGDGRQHRARLKPF